MDILLQKSAAFELVLADPQVQGFYAAPGPVGVVFFACQLRNQFVATAARPGVRQFDKCASFGPILALA